MHTHTEEGTTRTVGYWWAVGTKRSPDSSLHPRLAASDYRSCLERHRVGQWLEEMQEKELLDATPVKGWRKREGREGWGWRIMGGEAVGTNKGGCTNKGTH